MCRHVTSCVMLIDEGNRFSSFLKKRLNKPWIYYFRGYDQGKNIPTLKTIVWTINTLCTMMLCDEMESPPHYQTLVDTPNIGPIIRIFDFLSCYPDRVVEQAVQMPVICDVINKAHVTSFKLCYASSCLLLYKRRSTRIQWKLSTSFV